MLFRSYTKRKHRQDRQKFFFYEMASYRDGTPSQGYIEDIRNVYRYFNQPFDHLIQDLNVEHSYYY